VPEIRRASHRHCSLYKFTYLVTCLLKEIVDAVGKIAQVDVIMCVVSRYTRLALIHVLLWLDIQ